MTIDEIRQDLRGIISEHLNVDVECIDDETTFDQLGADSLDKVELVLKAEELFNVEVNDLTAEKCKTFNDFVNLINDTIGECDTCTKE